MSEVRKDIDRAIRDERVLRETKGFRSQSLLKKKIRNRKLLDALRQNHRHGRPETPVQKGKSKFFKLWEKSERSHSQYGHGNEPPYWDEYGYDDEK